MNLGFWRRSFSGSELIDGENKQLAWLTSMVANNGWAADCRANHMPLGDASLARSRAALADGKGRASRHRASTKYRRTLH